MYLAHGEQASHDGINATSEKLKGFWWPKKTKAIRDWVRGCKCAGGRMVRRPDGQNKLFDSFCALQTIVIDYLVDTKLHADDSGCQRYILAMVDRATGFVVLANTKERSAKATAMALKKSWINRFGCPDFVFSDNEGAVKSELFAWLTRARWRAKTILFCPYQKSGGGMVERKIQEAETRTRAAVAAGDVPDAARDEWLAEISWEVNAHEGVGQPSSFESLYGLRPKTPLRAAVPIS